MNYCCQLQLPVPESETEASTPVTMAYVFAESSVAFIDAGCGNNRILHKLNTIFMASSAYFFLPISHSDTFYMLQVLVKELLVERTNRRRMLSTFILQRILASYCHLLHSMEQTSLHGAGAVYVSLGTKMKLGFIDGTFPRPAIGSPNFEQWRHVVFMLTSLIWNSISRDLVEAFMYVASRELWLESQGRYGCSNDPMLYRIQREISSISQNELSLTENVTKVKKHCNGLVCLAPTPKYTCGGCTCGINKAIADRDESTQLMQFLIGLQESFDS
ncbi:uncharacterized protein LOC110011704 [Sesamum indicum]|uniref:Uncharacterized protein LOC110011704 n=1 Tax=Sesamum indicum TaxID=4182 RepID=A0A8M8UVZ8_SESIN|nr:uncharacterized protein LOC110011704 [Sesamum indicum]